MIFDVFFWFITYPSAFFGTRKSFFTERRRPANSRAFCCQRWTSMVLLEKWRCTSVEGSTWRWKLNLWKRGEKCNCSKCSFLQLLYEYQLQNCYSFILPNGSKWFFANGANCETVESPKIVLPFSSRSVSPSWPAIRSTVKPCPWSHVHSVHRSAMASAILSSERKKQPTPISKSISS